MFRILIALLFALLLGGIAEATPRQNVVVRRGFVRRPVVVQQRAPSRAFILDNGHCNGGAIRANSRAFIFFD